MPFFGDTLGTATPVAFAGGVVNDTFAVGTNDVDMLRVTLEAGRYYGFDADGGGNAYLRVFDRNGVELKASDNNNAPGEGFTFDPYTELLAEYTGDYYVALSANTLRDYDPATTVGRPILAGAQSDTAGTLIITRLALDAGFPFTNSINAVVTDDPENGDLSNLLQDEDRQLRIEFANGAFADGFIDGASDFDLGRIALSAGDVVVVDVSNAAFDSVIRAYTSGGTQLGLDNDSGAGNEAELRFATPTGGTHYVSVSSFGNTTFNAVDGTGTVAGTGQGSYSLILHRNPTLVGNSNEVSDNLTGTTGADYIIGLSGNDTITGLDGDDLLAGGDQTDSLVGGNGNDRLYGEGGNDSIAGGTGNDLVLGGDGTDTIDGGVGDDVIGGGSGNDSVLGGGGADSLGGGEGNDTLRGGDDSDSVAGGEGNDSLTGDRGNDTLVGAAGADSLVGGDGNDLASGDADNDRVDGGLGTDTLFGGVGLDTLVGGDGNDSLFGENDNDRLDGGLGRDSLDGGFGNDVLIAGLGIDTLYGGQGNDTLNGGIEAGARDLFKFNAVSEGFDTIQDFQNGVDAIDLSTLFAFAGSVVNGGNFNQFVQIFANGGNSIVAVDANGGTGGFAFIQIAEVLGVPPAQLNAADFIL